MELHCLYLPRINHSLEEFTKVWNRHLLGTVNNWSPYKIWFNSRMSMDDGDNDSNVPDLEEFGIDDEGPLHDEQLNTVVVPDTFADIDNDVFELFVQHLEHAASSVFSHEIDYITEFYQAKQFLLNLI